MQGIWAWSGIYYGILWDFRVFGHKKQQRFITTAADVPSYNVPRFTSMSLSNTSGQVA